MDVEEQRRRPPVAEPYPYHTLEFPYQRALDAYVTRRDYLRLLVLTSCGLFLGTSAIAVGSWLPRRPMAPMRVAATTEVPEGQALQFHYPTPDDPALLIHLQGDRFVAYGQLCTHLACAVLWNREERVLECPCHEGFFDVETGRVIAGPPPRPLPRIELRIEGSDIVAVERVEG